MNEQTQGKVVEENDELLPFRIIAQAGMCRSCAFKALSAAEQGDFDRASDLLSEAKEASLAAHNLQTSLLTQEAQGNHSEVNLMMVHAQDHLMTAMLAYELIEHMVVLLKKQA